MPESIIYHLEWCQMCCGSYNVRFFICCAKSLKLSIHFPRFWYVQFTHSSFNSFWMDSESDILMDCNVLQRSRQLPLRYPLYAICYISIIQKVKKALWKCLEGPEKAEKWWNSWEWLFNGPSYLAASSKTLIKLSRFRERLGGEYDISSPVFVLPTSACDMSLIYINSVWACIF